MIIGRVDLLYSQLLIGLESGQPSLDRLRLDFQLL